MGKIIKEYALTKDEVVTAITEFVKRERKFPKIEGKYNVVVQFSETTTVVKVEMP